MRLPPRSSDPIKNMLLGLGIALFGAVVIVRTYFSEYSPIIGDIIVFVGLWITVSGYYSDFEPDE